jgi:hypothetical protein
VFEKVEIEALEDPETATDDGGELDDVGVWLNEIDAEDGVLDMEPEVDVGAVPEVGGTVLDTKDLIRRD